MEIELTETFRKQFLKADTQTAARMEACLHKIQLHPTIGKPLRYDKKGIRSLRSGNFRMLYMLEANKAIILQFERREDVYE